MPVESFTVVIAAADDDDDYHIYVITWLPIHRCAASFVDVSITLNPMYAVEAVSHGVVRYAYDLFECRLV